MVHSDHGYTFTFVFQTIYVHFAALCCRSAKAIFLLMEIMAVYYNLDDGATELLISFDFPFHVSLTTVLWFLSVYLHCFKVWIVWHNSRLEELEI